MSRDKQSLDVQAVPYEYRDAEPSKSIRDHLPKKWQSLLLIGPAGTGKTTQVWGLHRKHVRGNENNGRQKIHVISECGDIDRHRYDWSYLDAWAEFKGVLCVDDIGYRKPLDWTLQAIYYLATYRRAHGLRVIWTTNLSVDRLEEYYGAPIASRITGGAVVQTGGEDRRKTGSAGV